MAEILPIRRKTLSNQSINSCEDTDEIINVVVLVILSYDKTIDNKHLTRSFVTSPFSHSATFIRAKFKKNNKILSFFVLNSIAYWYIVSGNSISCSEEKDQVISFSLLSEIKESNYKKLKMIRFPNTLYKNNVLLTQFRID